MSTERDSGCERNEVYAEDSALTVLLGDHPKVKLLASLISESNRSQSASVLSNLSGLSEETVESLLEEFIAMNLVVDDPADDCDDCRYKMNRESEAAKLLAKLEWEAIDVSMEVREE